MTSAQKLTIIRYFVVMPLAHLAIIAVLMKLEYWYLAVIAGFLMFYPIHSLGSSSYHKLFAHRSFDPVPWYPYVVTFFGLTSFIGCPLVYSFVHRLHHRFSDQAQDPHSPDKGRFYAYIGWMFKFKVEEKYKFIIADLITKYKWMINVWRWELLFAVTVHVLMYFINPYLFCVFLIASLLSTHAGFYVNAYAHDPVVDGNHKAVDSVWKAKLISMVLLHKYHHDNPRAFDYSHLGVKDYSAWFIKNVFMKK